MYQRQTQKLQHQTTAHLAQTMKLLSMGNGELRQEIEKIINENPAVELKQENFCQKCGRKLSENQLCPICTKPKTGKDDEPIVFLSQRSDFQYTQKSTYKQDDDFHDDFMVAQSESLEEYVFQQIAPDVAESDRIIAAYMLNLLDEDGFIDEPDIRIAQYYHVPISRILSIRELINRADPLGVGVRNSTEALLIQIKVLSERENIPSYYIEIVKDELENLSKKRYSEISNRLGVGLEEIKQAGEFITKNLNPYPAHSHWGSVSSFEDDIPQVYTRPDVIISFLNNDPNNPIMVEVIVPYRGNLIVSEMYKQAVRNSKSEGKNNLKTDFDSANLFIKCLQQRNNTMQRLMEEITKSQKEFILFGEKQIKSMTRAEIAESLDLHESTISRAVANKSAQLPDGRIIPMSTFFDRSLRIRTILKEIIDNENPGKPLSDTKLAVALKEIGIDIARRTVAKYRKMEGILPSNLRKKQNN